MVWLISTIHALLLHVREEPACLRDPGSNDASSPPQLISVNMF